MTVKGGLRNVGGRVGAAEPVRLAVGPRVLEGGFWEVLGELLPDQDIHWNTASFLGGEKQGAIVFVFVCLLGFSFAVFFFFFKASPTAYRVSQAKS